MDFKKFKPEILEVNYWAICFWMFIKSVYAV